MAITDFLNAGTQMVSQFGGMALQNSYNKKAERRQDRYNRGALDYAISRQPQINQQNRQSNLKYWKDTSFPAQREMMEKAGLNAGLMYGGAGGAGGVSGNASGVANVAGVQTSAPDAQGAMQGAGMALMNAAQIKLMEAQARNLDADTNKKSGVDTEAVTLDNRIKAIQAEVNEATSNAQKESIWSKALEDWAKSQREATQFHVEGSTANDRIEQERLKTIQAGVTIKASQAGIALTEAEIAETSAKINKIVAEVNRMNIQNENERRDVLTRQLQQEFNTSDPAKIKQWMDVAEGVARTGKNVSDIFKPKGDVKIDNRKSYDNSTTNFNE